MSGFRIYLSTFLLLWAVVDFPTWPGTNHQRGNQISAMSSSQTDFESGSGSRDDDDDFCSQVQILPTPQVTPIPAVNLASVTAYAVLEAPVELSPNFSPPLRT